MAGSTETDGATHAISSRNIRTRSLQYALRAVRLYQHLQKQKDGAGWVIGKQFLRAATSVGANVEEAQAGESRSDFIHKLGIARKETRESLYWLSVLEKSELVSAKRLKPLIKETKELLNVITAIILSTKEKS